MADEGTNDGSIEAAVAQMHEARTEAAPEPKIKPEVTEPAATVATVDTSEEMPDAQDDAHDATPEEGDDTGQPTIDAPHGWTAEDKAWFDTLEPARQEAILRREKGSQAAESRRQNEHQAAVREAKAIADQAAQERQHLQSALQHYKHPMVTAFQHEFADLGDGRMDLFRLAQDPTRWGRYQAFQTSFQQLAQAERQLAQSAEQEENARLQEHISTRNTQIIEWKPELKDPAKFERYDAEVSNYLRGKKIPDERIMRLSFEEIEIVDDAMRFHRAEKARAAMPKTPPTPDGKVAIAGHLRTVPKVMKPGMGSSAGAADDKIAAIDQRAQRSGSVDDAAARIRARLSGARRA
jgi:hypothetical protein